VASTDVAIVLADEARHAVEETTKLAEALGCAVYASSLHASFVFPPGHPRFAGPLPATAAQMADILGRYRRVLAIGSHPFMAYPYTPGPAVPEHVELLHLSPDPAKLGRIHPARLALVGDPRATVAALLPRIPPTNTPAPVDQPDLEDTARSRYGPSPMDPMAAAHALLRAVDPDTPVVDEAITTGTYVRGFHRATKPGRYFFARGGGLGWGMPAAVGVSLAYDRRPVLCVVGDGSAMYSPQALWTAANQRTPVVFAVVVNREYRILKRALDTRKDEAAQRGNYVGMQLDGPEVDYVALARSMGVPGLRIDATGDIADAVAHALSEDGPSLLEIPIS
jgi:benzoylformate decarboxylase